MNDNGDTSDTGDNGDPPEPDDAPTPDESPTDAGSVPDEPVDVPIISADSPYPDEQPGGDDDDGIDDLADEWADDGPPEPLYPSAPPIRDGARRPPPAVPPTPPATPQGGLYPSPPSQPVPPQPHQVPPQYAQGPPQYVQGPSEPPYAPPPRGARRRDDYDPNEYYVATDWLRVVVGGLASLVVLVGIVILGLYLFDNFDPRTEEADAAEPTATPVELVPVYECAGNSQEAAKMQPPPHSLIAGRTAAGAWLAFRNPAAPPLQLWIRASDVPGFDVNSVGIVSCAESPTEFPTPLGTTSDTDDEDEDEDDEADATPSPSPTADATPTPLPAPTATPEPEATATPVPSATPVPTATPVPPTATPVPPTATPVPPTATPVPPTPTSPPAPTAPPPTAPPEA